MLRLAGLSVLVTVCLAHLGCRVPIAGGSDAADPAGPRTLAIVDVRVPSSPAPASDGVVVVLGDWISAVGRPDRVAMPAPATVLDGVGLTGDLTATRRATLTRWGVVTAVGTGARLENTLALRADASRTETTVRHGPVIDEHAR